MTVFFIVAGALAAVAVIAMVRPLLSRGSGAAASAVRHGMDVELYRDQLDEIDRDLERGAISPAEAEGARAEVSRRLLRAARLAESEGPTGRAPGDMTRKVALGLLAAPLVGAVVYLATGSPGTPDSPLAARDLVAERQVDQRPSQAEAEEVWGAEAEAARPEQDPEEAAMVDRLASIVAGRPDDVEGHRLLGGALMRAGRYAEAWPVLDRLAELMGDEAPADLHAARAEAKVLAAGGYVSPEAESAVVAALRADPSLPIARYYAALALAQGGRLPEAMTLWRGLVADSPADAPWMPAVREMLAAAEREQAMPPSAALTGPSAEDMEAAAAMSPEERQRMIADMVARLEERLASEGGSGEDWLRLITSHARLGDLDAARAAYARAIEALDEAEQTPVRAIAGSIGIATAGGAAGDAARGDPTGDTPRGSPTADAPRGDPTADAPRGDPTADAPRGDPTADTPRRGPTAADIAAAASMAPAERQAMIEGMVASLEDRLDTQNGAPEDWVRLMTSYMALGQRDEAARVYALSQERLRGAEAGFVREQALVMGLAER